MAFGFPKKTCLSVSSLKSNLLCLKTGEKWNCGGIAAWKSLLQFCFPVESLHLHEQPFESLLVVRVFAYTITDCLYFHFMNVKNDHRSKFSNLSNWKEESWKISGLQRDSNPWPPAMIILHFHRQPQCNMNFIYISHFHFMLMCWTETTWWVYHGRKETFTLGLLLGL